MAPAPARARANEVAEDEAPDEMELELASLQFDEALSWRAGKPIATGELLRRIERLSKELMEMDQDEMDKASLSKVAKDLASHNLLAHKEAGVKAFTACCLVDILRICAPDAPFTHTQLKDIFSLFIKSIIPALWDPTHAYNTQHKYVLASLTEVKSILLVNELANAEALLLHLFSSVFDGVSASSISIAGEQVTKDVEFHMSEILVILVDEGPHLPASVLDVIMAQFLRAAPPGGNRDKAAQRGKQTTLLPKEEPEAYIMAKTLCNTCPDKMSRYVSQYFSDVIMDVSGKGGHGNGHKDGHDLDSDDGPTGPSEADFRELRKAHQLLRELWRAAPTVLENVIPQVDAELAADSVQLRLLATETLGDMISGIGAAGPPPGPVLDAAAYPPVKLSDEAGEGVEDSILTSPISPLSFSQTHPQAFHNFSGRLIDKSGPVRAAWTTAAGYILSTSAGGIGLSREDESLLIHGLRDKLNDNDEKVRLAAVKAVETFSFRDIVTKLAANGGADKEGSVLSTLADRCRDKRPPIRVEAMVLLGKLWGVATGELLAGQEAVTWALSSIPSRVFNTFYANDAELNVLLERVVFEYIVPLSFPPPKAKAVKASNGNSQAQSQSQAPMVDRDYDPDSVRAERILLLVKGLDERAKTAFFALQKRQPQFSSIMETYLRQCEAFNGGASGHGADVAKANLKKTILYMCNFFHDQAKVEADLNNFAILNDRRNYQLVRFAIGIDSDFKTMYRAIKELNKRIQGTSKPHVLDTLLPLLYRSSYIMFNKSHLSTFMDYSKSDKSGFGSVAHQITNEISQSIPDLFKTHIGQLCKDLIDGAPSAAKENDAALVESLKACSSYSRKYPKELPSDRGFVQALMSHALYGQPAKAAKYAVNIMLARNDKHSLVTATELFQRATKGWGYGSPHFLNKLAAVSQLELLAGKVTADAKEEIMEVALDKVLLDCRTPAQASDPLWVEEEDAEEEMQLKCWALKLIVNRLRGTKDADEAKEMAPTVFKLLSNLIKNEGELRKTRDTPRHHKSRLRLLAGQLILKLCTSALEKVFTHKDYDVLALLAQDACQQVRHRLVEKLQKYLANNKLRPRFYAIIFLTAFEPVASFRQQVETWIRSRARSFRESNVDVMESTLGRLISLLAHHPDYNADADELVDHARYLVYYVTNVATEANFNMLIKYAERVKQTRDGVNPSESDNLYVISDLAQAVVRKWGERKNWSFKPFSAKVGLPLGLYTVLPSHSAAQEIAEKNYLPDGVEDRIDDLLRSLDKRKKRKSSDERPDGDPAQKKAKRVQAKPKPAIRSKTAASAKKATTKTKTPARSRKAVSASSLVPEPGNRRQSNRSKKNSSYIEPDSSDDEDGWEASVAAWDYYDQDGNLVAEAEGATTRKPKKVANSTADDSESPLSDIEIEDLSGAGVESEPDAVEEDVMDKDQAQDEDVVNSPELPDSPDEAESSVLSEPNNGALEHDNNGDMMGTVEEEERAPSPPPQKIVRRRGRSRAAPAVTKAEAVDDTRDTDMDTGDEEESASSAPPPKTAVRRGKGKAAPVSTKAKTVASRSSAQARAVASGNDETGKSASAKGKARATTKKKPTATRGRATRSRQPVDEYDIEDSQ